MLFESRPCRGERPSANAAKAAARNLVLDATYMTPGIPACGGIQQGVTLKGMVPKAESRVSLCGKDLTALGQLGLGGKAFGLLKPYRVCRHGGGFLISREFRVSCNSAAWQAVPIAPWEDRISCNVASNLA